MREKDENKTVSKVFPKMLIKTTKIQWLYFSEIEFISCVP